MTISYRLARWWAHRRLRRGQCSECGVILPDDAPSRGYRGGLCADDTCGLLDWSGHW